MLRVRDLKTHLHLKRGIVKAVDGVSFDLASGETLGLIGESGSGKNDDGVVVTRSSAPPGWPHCCRIDQVGWTGTRWPGRGGAGE